jgi:FkbM family methyltransferase
LKPDTEDKRRKAAIDLAMSGRYQKYQYYEGVFTDKFARAVPGKVVVDCGMCYGYYTALALWAGCHSVYGFEADDERHGLHLRETLGGRSDVTMRFCAVGGKVGSIELVSRPGTLRSWSATEHISKLRGNPNKRATKKVTVPCDTIDNSIVGPVGVIKCDTEGGEATIFHGAKRILGDYHPAIFLELHQIGRDAKLELQRLLRSFDYPAEFMKATNNRHILEAKR